jgi:hypothetical protein
MTAERRAAQDVLRGMQGSPSTGGGQIHYMRMEQKGDALLEEFKKLAREDQELFRALQRLAELKEALGGRVGKRR